MKGTVIGLGKVGSAIGFSLANSEIFDVLHFIDIDQRRAEGEALDISHSLANGTAVTYGGYEGARNSDFIYITAGVPRKKGQLREDLFKINKGIVEDILSKVSLVAPDATYIVSTNPVDLMVKVAVSKGIDPKKILGLGSLVDTFRFKDLLARKYGTHKKNIECMVIGEHGKNMIPVISKLVIDGQEVSIEDTVVDNLVGMGARMNETKQGASFVVGNAALKTTRLLLEGGVCPASVLLSGEYGIDGATIGVPVVLENKRIKEILEIDLSEQELTKLKERADHIKNWSH